ncbi:MAG: leucyl aminopeptidase [Ahrensia sp.]|nr:leucyl aminopeptidase [Ahrensia sp.]
MSKIPSISFTSATPAATGRLLITVGKDGALGTAGQSIDESGVLSKAMKAADFDGAFGKMLDIVTPHGTGLDVIVLVGLGDVSELNEQSWWNLGGKMSGKLDGQGKSSLVLEMPGEDKVSAKQATDLAAGVQLAAYSFDTYKTMKDDKRKKKSSAKPALAIHVSSASAAKKLWSGREGVAAGVMLARDLVNEPANVLTPIEFAKRAKALEKLGCKVDVLDEKAMKRLKMATLLGVAQGSRSAPRMAIIEWKGGKAKDKPIAFVGKGVTFDTGGISLKPGAGMGDMKGDMGGAAAVTGLMHALAARKAKANVVGVIALVENMPDGNAQRPGDIITSMSGQTVEILNTDAEGRLILADALWHTNKKFKPSFMVDLATLTGAILIALGDQHAGLFSNDDTLADNLFAAGQATDEKVWRMPLSKAYDKLIDTKNADMKNIGGRNAGSITAAQFLQRFVGETPWAHLDIAGTALASPKSDINKGWASGFGVRLLDRLVADNYES